MSAKNTQRCGNAAALREAILAIKDINDRRPHDADGYEINDIIDDVLSAPLRNCDVGTPEEQIERHDEHYCCEDGCSSIYSCRRCFAEWAQMPYDNKPTATNEKQEESK